jgi:uncharacterized protein YndB with AHSA1/START domain
MATITSTIIIDRPVEDVFAFIADYANDARWRAGVQMESTPPGPARVGTTTREVVRFMGNDTITLAEVIACAPDRRIDFRSTDGPYPVVGFRAVAPVEGGTEFTYTLTIELSGLYKAMSAVVVPIFRQQIAGDLRRLKELLEQPAHAAA